MYLVGDIMEGITVRDVMESSNKSYIDKHTPIRFFRSEQDYFLDEEGTEYICSDVSFGTTRSNGWFFFDEPNALLFELMPIDKWIEYITYVQPKNTKYGLYSIVNVANIVEKVDFMIWHKILETEKEKKRNLTEEENIAIVTSYFDLPVLCKIKREDSYYPVFATKNVYREANERMRFFFCINDCVHCEYYREKKDYNECVNVISNNYGITEALKSCQDFKEKCI